MRKHKLRIWRGGALPLWYVECSCGWEPYPAKVDGHLGWLHGRKFWALALIAGQDHLREEATRPWRSTTTNTAPGVQISS